MKKIINILIYAKWIIYYAAACIIGLFARHLPKYKDLWLVCERKTDARDNGYHFFCYLKKHTNVNCAYIIKKSSPDYKKIADIGSVIEPQTFLHMLAFACARVKVSTHYMGYAPDTYRFAVINRFCPIFKRNVMLQHGVTANDLTELHYPNARVDLMTCTAISEYDYMIKHYNHPAGVVQRLGLCRYDRLLENHTAKKRILVMPTWRYFLYGLSDDEFEKSDYFKNFSSLINNERLNRALKKYGYELVFYMHYEMQPYSHLFKAKYPCVKIMTMENADVQQLLISSSFLVTDYSSVFFDFAYMGKPLLYFWFDENEFYKMQYARGYFDYRKNGFGPVVSNVSEAVLCIIKNIEEKMQPEAIYQKRISDFFGLRSADCCKRTYEAIKKITDR